MPTYHRFEMTKRCLESVIPHVNSSVYDTTLFICDNNSPKEMTDWLETLTSDRIVLYKCNKNVGKARIINKAYSQNTDCTHVISIDSDMVATGETNWIDTMVWASEHFTDFGLLSTIQLENDQQLWNGLKKIIEIEKHKVHYGQYNCVAGGCIILKKELWDKVRYSEYGNVYGYDDAILMMQVYQLGKKVGVLDNVKLIHPHDEDKGYIQWKSENIRHRKMQGYYDS